MSKKDEKRLDHIEWTVERIGHRLNTITGALSERIQALEPPMDLTVPVADAIAAKDKRIAELERQLAYRAHLQSPSVYDHGNLGAFGIWSALK